MNKYLLFFFLLSTGLFSNSKAQELWGLNQTQGTYGYGTIYKVNPDGSGFTVMHNFNETDGALPLGSLNLGPEGKIYGICYSGVASGLSTIFRIDPITGVFEHLWSFNGMGDGCMNTSGIISYGGDVYGCSSSCGPNYDGTIYKWDVQLSVFSVIHEFDELDGAEPVGEPLLIGGKIYGTTITGGMSGASVLFEFDLETNAYDVLYEFPWCPDPVAIGGMILANDGRLYGMTADWGTYDDGTIYRYDFVNGLTYEHNFESAEGSCPTGKLLEASNNILYGMTSKGGTNNHGTIFSFDPVSNTHTVLHHFDSLNGTTPYGDLTQVGNKLIGYTYGGGVSGIGVLFSYDFITGTFTKLKDFDSVSGGMPIYGTLFEFNPNQLTAHETVKHPVRLYPTITTGVIHLTGITSGNLRAYDLAGNIILSEKLEGPTATINMNVSPGIYTWYYIENGFEKSGKLIIE